MHPQALPADPLPAHRLSLARIAAAPARIAPEFLQSPQYDCEPLSAALGCTVTLKVETVNPIRSFKGRGAERLVAAALESEPRRPLACASAGNWGQAVAWSCRRRGAQVRVWAATTANRLKVERMRALGALVRLEGGDFDAAKAAARAWAAGTGARFLEDGLDVEAAEGAGTMALELTAAGGQWDAACLPLGNGALLTGNARWLKAALPGIRVAGVVASGAPAMRDSWLRGPGAAVVETTAARTIADGIAVRVPIPEAVADMHGLVDVVHAVEDEALRDAMRLLHRHAGLVVEPAGAAGLAGVLAARADYAGARVVVPVCGGNVDPSRLGEWLLGAP
ncbi:MAG: threonine/serine dehydratase [Betaproteobacteria bacterium]|jgi:threonine dehydratase|nr:pyridoxal-phosphate dependent enzyme [Rhodocyclaceae bacterium]MCA3134434.1 pyridoxal-phosphate dependent enzyme [Rhodocyclaceae bacterium]MCA3142417.1 pyridoxal-phosphate dependent enzyme [Rhodocyclaceae bacterium]MCA3145001.1 pyridoxal-phosphate dependent enzyme [Rhodocyclaceae bacterium]MCE2898648.1 pyridoxal-phosphate dependent enzyme [Betaproteobacteria bacterium]